MDELDLPSEDAAALVDLLDRKLRAVEFRHAHERKIAGDVFEQADLQRIGRLGGPPPPPPPDQEEEQKKCKDI